MARVHRDDIATPIAEAGCASRIMVNTAVGAAAGLLGAWGMLVFKRPSADPKLNPAAIFSKLCLDVMPLTTGGALLYTTLSCTLESNRSARDWRNSAAGGAVTGALVLGVKLRSAPAALVGALIFGAGAAAPDVMQMMNTLPAEFDAGTPSAAAARPASPAQYAANASGSQRLTSRLQ